jgi:hypothetical protein
MPVSADWIDHADSRLAMSLGRPSPSIHMDSIRGARRLLRHHLSTEFDSRLVHFCELEIIRRKQEQQPPVRHLTIYSATVRSVCGVELQGGPRG